MDELVRKKQLSFRQPSASQCSPRPPPTRPSSVLASMAVIPSHTIADATEFAIFIPPRSQPYVAQTAHRQCPPTVMIAATSAENQTITCLTAHLMLAKTSKLTQTTKSTARQTNKQTKQHPPMKEIGLLLPLKKDWEANYVRLARAAYTSVHAQQQQTLSVSSSGSSASTSLSLVIILTNWMESCTPQQLKVGGLRIQNTSLSAVVRSREPSSVKLMVISSTTRLGSPPTESDNFLPHIKLAYHHHHHHQGAAKDHLKAQR
ncbi:hypothetical protein TcWFU_006530 [Taenia crassiceps]|uniref:Uncharacterized protein n=1 Tax=Taenia crassiceps TaxID=6207 RepID=A0ABR4Q2J4_9CEST